MFCQIIESPWYVTAKILLPNACWSRRMFCWLLVSCSDKSDFFPFEKLTETKSFALLSSAKAFLAAYIEEGNALLTAINGMCVLIIGSISFLASADPPRAPSAAVQGPKHRVQPGLEEVVEGGSSGGPLATGFGSARGSSPQVGARPGCRAQWGSPAVPHGSGRPPGAHSTKLSVPVASGSQHQARDRKLPSFTATPQSKG